MIKGQIFSQEDLYVDGQIEGTVELPGNRLTVGKSGKVQASIKAREVDALGAVNGNILAGERITIRKDANLVGDLKSASVSIEDGAYFKGSIDIVRPPPAKPAPAAPPPPPSPSAGRTVTPPAGPPPPGGSKPAP